MNGRFNVNMAVEPDQQVTAVSRAEAELVGSAMTYGAVILQAQVETIANMIGNVAKAIDRGADNVPVSFDYSGPDVALHDLRAAALAYAVACGYKAP